jgi:hypothetical protein
MMEATAEPAAGEATAEPAAMETTAATAESAATWPSGRWVRSEGEADEGRRQDRNQGSHGITPLKGAAPSRSLMPNNPERRRSFS